MSEEIREKIAKAKGYQWWEIGNHSYLVDAVGRGMVDKNAVLIGEPHPESNRHYRCPDWPNSIADAYELEAEIPEEQRDLYCGILLGVVYGDLAVAPYWPMVHATALERSQAWLILQDVIKPPADGAGG